MTSTQNFGLLAARILLGAIFVMAGMGKLADVQGFAGYMASGGVPAIFAWPVVLFEILGGLALIVGLQTRATALALGAFSILAALLYHFDPADQGQMTHLLKNFAMAGGYIAVALTGAGQWSVDSLLGNRGPAVA